MRCWNLRILYQIENLAQVVREMEFYKIKLFGISEARWIGDGLKQLVSGPHVWDM